MGLTSLCTAISAVMKKGTSVRIRATLPSPSFFISSLQSPSRVPLEGKIGAALTLSISALFSLCFSSLRTRW